MMPGPTFAYLHLRSFRLMAHQLLPMVIYILHLVLILVLPIILNFPVTRQGC
jgi:hypothetical protein